MNPGYTKEELALLSEVLKNLHGIIQKIKNNCDENLKDIKKKEERQQRVRLDRIGTIWLKGSTDLKQEWDKLSDWSQDKLNLETIENGPTLNLIHLKNWIYGLDIPLKRHNLITILNKLKEDPGLLMDRSFSRPNPVIPLTRVLFQLPSVIETIYKRVYRKKMYD